MRFRRVPRTRGRRARFRGLSMQTLSANRALSRSRDDRQNWTWRGGQRRGGHVRSRAICDRSDRPWLRTRKSPCTKNKYAHVPPVRFILSPGDRFGLNVVVVSKFVSANRPCCQTINVDYRNKLSTVLASNTFLNTRYFQMCASSRVLEINWTGRTRTYTSVYCCGTVYFLCDL